MESRIAIIGSQETAAQTTDLRDVLEQRGVTVDAGPESGPRDVLRWAMELDPARHALCVFIDPDGRLTASLATALDPAIIPFVWAAPPADSAKISTFLSETTAVISFAANATLAAAAILNILPASSGRKTASPATTPTARIKSIQPSPPAPPSPQPPTHDEQDLAVYQQLEAMMSAPVKKVVPRQEPVMIQSPGMDFSLPLRELMTRGRRLAQENGNSEVLGVHYVASLDEPYRSLFLDFGVDDGSITDYVADLKMEISDDSEPYIGDEVFSAVSIAKSLARERKLSHVRVADFLLGLLKSQDSSLADFLGTLDIKPAQISEMILTSAPAEESGSAPFFQPSSRDQDGFYEFDPDSVQSIRERLKSLPGFQKAAERIAEARKVKTGEPRRPEPMLHSPTRGAAPAPASPEYLKVSGDFPSVDVIEQTTDRLLEGQVVVFPSDIMTAIAADATNSASIERLRQTADLPDEKPLGVLINSTSQLKHLVRADLEALEPLLDDLWPGPLTLLFESAPTVGKQISPGGRIAVRIPDDNVSLALLSMLGRPLAVTSLEIPAEAVVGHAGVVINSQQNPTPARTTVVDMTQTPWAVIREGAVPSDQVLKYYPGD